MSTSRLKNKQSKNAFFSVKVLSETHTHVLIKTNDGIHEILKEKLKTHPVFKNIDKGTFELGEIQARHALGL